jgi:uncharacterized protein YjbJ (UPF0337 family)
MGELKNKVEGNLKKTAGEVTGDEDLKARGQGQRTIGKAEEGGRKLRGAVEEGIGRLTGDHSREADGRLRQG